MSAEQIYAALEKVSDYAAEELTELGLRDGLSQEDLLSLFELCSDRTYSELVDLGIFGPVLTFDQIMDLCSGTDEGGFPNSFGVLAIDTVTKDMDTIPYANVSFGMPVINLYGSGGCVVVTADFEAGNMFEYRRARDILDEWFSNRDNPEFQDKILSLIISPVLLNGELMTIFHECVFAQGVAIDKQVYRLIMAFDNNQSQEVLNSELKLDALKASVEAEIARRAEEAKQELAAAEEETESEDQEEYNPYAESVMREYNVEHTVFLPDEDEDGDKKGEDEESESDSKPEKTEWMRFSKDD